MEQSEKEHMVKGTEHMPAGNENNQSITGCAYKRREFKNTLLMFMYLESCGFEKF